MSTTSCSTCDTKPASVGWVYESSGRGTLTLVNTCLFTIFLCNWVVIHPRVYKRRLFTALYKISLFIKAVLAPELIAVEGLQEWTQCRKMKRECARIVGDEFKLIHAFYISMLALRYRTPRGDRVIWPNQYTWLLQQRLIDWKDHESWGLDERVIRDKSNADSAVKLVAFCQVLWFVAQSIMRTAHGLPLSQLESMTLSYIPLFAATYFFWWIKPKDIKTPSIVELPNMLPEQRIVFESMVISNKFDDEGLEQQVSLWNVWYLTPRVFEKEAEDRAAKISKVIPANQNRVVTRREERSEQKIDHEIDVEEATSQDPATPKILTAAKETVLSHWDPELYHSKLWPVICLFGVSFGALHLISWNTMFPTIVELWLWRIAALVSIFSMLVFMHFEKVVFRWGGPLTIISILSPAFYLISRLAMMGEVIAALRSEDPRIYETYVASTYWIHLL
ncbi:hypothetical protein NA56DRAFT_643584 [Hyaloscypha hepaticicola]|uniref:Uncharacterized protein n=1 Tax=Hyaloscypha hepaticicola TaxID=2082293 RepID=A0A2J6QDP1_9HELO|nr:hypothetical protein NA56DRAFT_643584 [Hyaloscypha hepaticicola]